MFHQPFAYFFDSREAFAFPAFSFFEAFMRWILILLLLVQTAHAVEVGESVPDFALQDLDNRSYRPDQFRGRVLVLYFMGYD